MIASFELPGSPGSRAEAHRRIAGLASRRTVHAAFGWLHLHEPQLRSWQLEMLAIPAPPFGEARRAQWFLDRFTALGLTNAHLDAEGNALAELGSSATAGAERLVLLSAHLDTVFPPGTATSPREQGPVILAPGACDNAAGLTALLALAAAMQASGLQPAKPILFAANVGEEGEGDLRGMRHLLEQGPYRGRIAGALALEGAGTATAVDRALGSVRLRVTVTGPGGHSWTDSHVANPILLLARGLTALANRLPSDHEPRTTFSPGQISGGFSINSIPSSATVALDLRSTDPDVLLRHELEVHRTFEGIVASAMRDTPTAALQIERIGNRPAASLPRSSPLLESLAAVDRHLQLRTELRLGSTDSNLPLALGLPALALSAGGTGGGIHTLGEWYDPTGREIALRRILLLLLDATQTLA